MSKSIKFHIIQDDIMMLYVTIIHIFKGNKNVILSIFFKRKMPS
jgi:hypothetical protein